MHTLRQVTLKITGSSRKTCVNFSTTQHTMYMQIYVYLIIQGPKGD